MSDLTSRSRVFGLPFSLGLGYGRATLETPKRGLSSPRASALPTEYTRDCYPQYPSL